MSRPTLDDEVIKILRSAYPAWLSAADVSHRTKYLTVTEAAQKMKWMANVETMKTKNNLNMYRIKEDDK